MLVREVMSEDVITITPGLSLRAAAKLMTAKNVGSVVVHDPEGQGVGIITERDILRAVAADQDPDVEVAGDHQTTDVVFAAPTWTLHDAADAMKRGGFRHLVVLDQGEIAGIISVRDIVKVWSAEHEH